MILFFLFVFLIYCGLIIYLTIGFTKQQSFKRSKKKQNIGFSIIIPFRNEAKNLPKLLVSLEKIVYSPELFEIIFVNDNSDDYSKKIIEKFSKKHSNYLLIENKRTTNSPKKDAIVTALKKTAFDWIITTDADCLLPKDWLITLNDFIIEKNPNMVVAPVNYKVNNTFLEQFQLFDFMSLQAATIGGFGNAIPFLCNGANLAYKKNIFNNVNGFKGNTSIASGDDIFLLEKFLDYDKNSVQYLKNKNVIVTTFPVNSWKKLLQQRIRWASKSANITLVRAKLIGLIIFLGNLFLLLNLFFTKSALLKLGVLFLKISLDLILLLPTLHFFEKQKKWWKYYFLSSLLYPFFSVLVVFLSTFIKYSWKGRTFKK